MNTIKYFFSCDWGTTSFRLRLVQMGDCKIIAEATAVEGIAATYAAWEESGKPEENRERFYLSVIKRYIGKIEDTIGHSLRGIQVIISGMASSSIGFVDIPYSQVLGDEERENIKIAFLPASSYFDHNVLVISGIRTDDDVIRGEETQLIGCADLLQGKIADEMFIFPGTHSKHIHVIDDHIIGFKTYMTGEFFELLSQKSILTNSVETNDDLDADSFKKGVNDAEDSNLLNAAFKVRTNNLFDKLSKRENLSYLSGLLIATELKGLAAMQVKKINLLCGTNLKDHYVCALQELGLSGITQTYDAGWVDTAVVRGHYKIYKQSLL